MTRRSPEQYICRVTRSSPSPGRSPGFFPVDSDFSHADEAHRRVAGVAIGAAADFTQLDGETNWDRPNRDGRDHDEDIWNDVPVVVVVAGHRVEVVGGAETAGE